jgi:hypothetical protein
MGTQNSRMQAKTTPPVVYRRAPGRTGYARELLVAAVVEMVSVAV